MVIGCSPVRIVMPCIEQCGGNGDGAAATAGGNDASDASIYTRAV